MSGFTKLFSSIVTSTIWQEDSDTCKIWVTMLALADAQGFVDATVPGLANLAKVPIDKTRDAIKKFLSPDPDSRSKEYEGRRITETDGGWILLNYTFYREQRDPEERKQYMREYMQKYRKQALTSVNNVNTETGEIVNSVNSCKSPLAQAEAEAEGEKQKKKKNTEAQVYKSLQPEQQKTLERQMTPQERIDYLEEAKQTAESRRAAKKAASDAEYAHRRSRELCESGISASGQENWEQG